MGEIKDLRVTHVLDALNDILAPHIFPSPTDGSSPRKCPSCADGQLSLKLGKFGSFVGCSNYPECKYTRQMTANGEGEIAIPPEGIELGVASGYGREGHPAAGALRALPAAWRGSGGQQGEAKARFHPAGL